LKARRSGVDTRDEPVVYMRADCPVCRSEGFRAHARVVLTLGDRRVIATVHHVYGELFEMDEAGLSEAAWTRLDPRPGDLVAIEHPKPLLSMSAVRGKIYGERLTDAALDRIVADLVAGRYSDIEASAFISACAAHPLDLEEIHALTRSMVEAGERMHWDRSPIADKHCVGGLPGNRTTPIVVAILATLGATIPKTSSRAITSPAGTADTMETLAPVELDVPQMRKVVERTGGCIIWGGAVRFSPADDLLIRIERALDIDSEGQLVASVLSKKIAAGATHLVVDIPVGPTAKVRDEAAARRLGDALQRTASGFGLTLRALVTNGEQPVGCGIGPALEARDVLAVLRGDANAPGDLRDRSLALAGALLELVDLAADSEGTAIAARALADGRAWETFQRICEEQGGMREPPVAAHTHGITTPGSGVVASIDNRKLARIAKLAGAPDDKAAGVELHVRLGEAVEAGQPVYTIHSEHRGGLDYALGYAEHADGIVSIGEAG
jgi:thymidine phosphorylase